MANSFGTAPAICFAGESGNLEPALTGLNFDVNQAGNSLYILWHGPDLFWQQVDLLEVGDPVQWIGNVYHWPWTGDIDAGDEIWINIESWPKDAAVSARVVYSDDGGSTWYSVDMTGEEYGNNDHWYVNIGSFASGTQLQYAIEVLGGAGDSHWDSNGGGNHHLHVN